MKINKGVKESFTVIGKEGSTLDGEGFIQKLWENANTHFVEVEHLAKKDENGNLCGIWGAMSDFSRSFMPWEDFSKGLYLAGVECNDDAEAPAGWTKWRIPGYEYIYVEREREDIFQKVMEYLKDNGIPLVGAVHDFTCPKTGKDYMYFPIKKLRPLKVSMIDTMPVMLERKVIYESDWVALYADKVRMPDGRIFDSYHKLHYPHESVSVVIVNEKDEIMMIQSKRYITSRLEWEIPAGRIEGNETPEAAARRECMEETGCILKDLNYLCCYNPSNGMSDLKIHLFMARVETETSDIDENEVNAKRWVSKEEVLDILKNNRSQCGISMLGLLYAIQFIRF